MPPARRSGTPRTECSLHRPGSPTRYWEENPLSGTSDQKREIEALRERIAALSAAVLRVSSSLEFDTVLRQAAEAARALTGARYAAITTVDGSGRLDDLVIDGFTPEEARRIVEWTDLMQVFETLRDLPSPVRVADMPGYVGALGYSTEGVIVKTFLGTPMRHRGEQVGNFFLGEKQTGSEFTAGDEKVLALLASQAAAATANARA